MSIGEEPKPMEARAEIYEKGDGAWSPRLGNLGLELERRTEKESRLVFVKSENVDANAKNLPVVGTSFLRAACKDANGFFRCQTLTNRLGRPPSQVIHESWFCFKTKQVDPYSDKYFWQQVNVFVTWSSEYSATMLLCVDAPDKVRESILHAADTGTVDGSNPYGWHRHIVAVVLDLYDESFWSLRDKVRYDVEKKRDITTATNFHVLHDLARHMIHLEETLEVALTTIEGMQAAQDVLREEVASFDLPKDELDGLLRENALEMYHSCGAIKASAARAKSLSSRLNNEINLAFNLVMQYDSRTMKIIAIVTLIFLPGSYVASIFGMSFFDFSAGHGHVLADGFWIYWVITAGLTALAVAWWILWQRLEGPGELTLPNKLWRLKKTASDKP